MRTQGHLWTQKEIKQLKKLLADGLSHAVIGERMNRTEAAVQFKLRSLSASEKQLRRWKDAANAKRRLKRAQERLELNRNAVRRVEDNSNFQVPPAVLEDRSRRRELEHQSLTSAFFGDPLPGYSALDQNEKIHQATKGQTMAALPADNLQEARQ